MNIIKQEVYPDYKMIVELKRIFNIKDLSPYQASLIISAVKLVLDKHNIR